MTREEFDDLVAGILMRVDHSPAGSGGIDDEIAVGFEMAFVDGNSEQTVDNMRQVLHELRKQVNAYENALERVIEEGEMGL